MSIKLSDYFNSTNLRKYPNLDEGPLHCKTIENLYDSLIRVQAKKLFVDKKTNLIKWLELIKNYCEVKYPIYWIRKFESGGDKAKQNDNRRGTLTLVANEKNEPVFGYAYISNFDAQELYNMILQVEEPELNDFKNLMFSGEYQFHFDNGNGSTENDLSAYKCLESAQRRGVFNRANYYLAHIWDANQNYSKNPFEFKKDNVTDWGKISELKGKKGINKPTEWKFPNNKKIRVKKIESSDEKKIMEIKEFFKANFLRFVIPFNYFLVPGEYNEINAFYGKSKKSIGEYKLLIEYVRAKIYEQFIANDSDLKSYFDWFENSILAPTSSTKAKDLDSKKIDKIGNTVIHIVYGTKIGKEGELISILESVISNLNINMIQDIKEYVPNKTVFRFDDVSGNKLKDYCPQKDMSPIELFEKFKEILKKCGVLGQDEDQITKVTIRIESKTTCTKKFSSSSKKRLPNKKCKSNVPYRGQQKYSKREFVFQALKDFIYERKIGSLQEFEQYFSKIAMREAEIKDKSRYSEGITLPNGETICISNQIGDGPNIPVHRNYTEIRKKLIDYGFKL